MTTQEDRMRAALETEFTKAMVDGIELAFDYMIGTLRRSASTIGDADLPCSKAQADAVLGTVQAFIEIQPLLIADVRGHKP